MMKNYFDFSILKKAQNNYFFCIVIMCFFNTNIFSQTPSDDCDNSLGAELTVNSSCTFTAWDSNNNSDYWNSAAGCNAADRDDAWGWFDAIATTTTITYSPDTRNAVLTLFEGACATNMTAVACADAFGNGGDETITYATTPGLRYRVRIQRFNNDNNMTGDICVYSPLPPTITSLSNASGCVGSTLVINGTNLTGATAVTIGGTAATITGNTATTVTVTVGTGTTGTVQVTTPSGTATSAATFTVNPLPAAIGGGAATVCVGGTTPAFTNATGGGTWSITNGTGSATISAGGVVTGVSVGTATVVYTLPTSCSISTPITIVTTPNITTNPLDFTTSNGGAASFTVVANNVPTSYTWEVSTDGGTIWSTVTNGGVYSNATTATLNITGATLAMDGYMYRASATNTCGTSAFSASATLTVSNIVLVSGAGVNNITCGNNAIIRDHADLANYGINRDDFTVINANSTAVINISGNYDVENNFDFIRIYDGVGTGGALIGQFTGVGTIDFTANVGQTITIRFQSDNSVNRPGFEFNVNYTGLCDVPCVAPTALPTALSLVPYGTVISGSFTHAVPQPDNYLVVISTNAVPPTPTNGTSYPIGSTVGAGYTVISNGPSNAFSATGLANSTTYYIYVFSLNSLCVGGPLYLGNLNGSTTTTGSDPYCIPTSDVSTRYIENVSTVGYITDISNFGTGRAASGYADYTAAPPVTQIPGGGVTIDYFLRISRQFVKIWVDWNNDGTFTDAAPELVYTTGGIQTIAGAGGFVIPPATLPGNYRIRIRSFETSQTFGPCGNLTTGETEDYTLTVVADCPALVTTVVDGDRCDVGTVVLGVQGTPGVTEFRFYDAQYGGSLVGTEPAVPGTTNWTTPALTNTTTYYVTAFNGSCESWYREQIVATINPISNITVTPSVPEVCGENNIVQITAGGDFVIDYLVDEDFEGGGFGVLTRVNVAANADTQWTNRTSPYVPAGFVWKPAITSKNIGNRFALANSDFAAPNPKDTQLRTAVLDASAFSDLFLRFRHYFSYYPGEPVQFADIDVSTNGGTIWTNITQYTSNQGFAGQFNDVILDLSAYAGQPSVMIRFRYNLAGGSAWADGWAVDDIQVYGTRPLNTTFTWTGGTVDAFIDPACTVPYVAQSVSTVYVRPTPVQLASTSWSFTANATLGNGCPISEFIEIFNRSKVWNGSVNNDWNNPNNWSPNGIPDINTCVIIPDVTATNPSNILGASYNAYGRTLQVKDDGILNVVSGNTLTIQNFVEVSPAGTFNIENNSSLIQIDNVANTGSITMDRNAVTDNTLDYVYWSTPVAGFDVGSITPSSSYVYQWEPTVATAYAGDFGIWTAASGAMTTGRGYIIRGSSGISTFDGVPNNGDITTPISRSTYTGANYAGPTATPVTADDDNWNLLGNPYPSAISADDFLTVNSGNLDQFVKIWTHGIDPAAIADPFYQDFQLNYDVADYITYNALGGTQSGFDGYIGAGQGFFVLMNDAASTSENAIFTNSMRSNTYRNDQFYRNTAGEIEKHRIWLKLVAPNGSSSDALVGYATDASNEFDTKYDANAGGVKSTFEIYSIIEDKALAIQGKALPFDENDKIQLGVSIPENGIYTIAINNTDGVFKNSQDVYLEDLELDIIYDLKATPYTFMANSGRYNNRFVLRYTNESLKTNDFNFNSVFVYTNDNLNITSKDEKLKEVSVYDLLGRSLYHNTNVNQNEISIQQISPTQSGLIINVTLVNGQTKTFKVIY